MDTDNRAGEGLCWEVGAGYGGGGGGPYVILLTTKIFFKKL